MVENSCKLISRFLFQRQHQSIVNEFCERYLYFLLHLWVWLVQGYLAHHSLHAVLRLTQSQTRVQAAIVNPEVFAVTKDQDLHYRFQCLCDTLIALTHGSGRLLVQERSLNCGFP